ncbi:MAG TPA: 4Fe-4S dicluster domain-containing protein [Bacteroidales bacterium]|nr:4Fe-4S dicluster domain-containing protein [Bacteroidales bacterium]
MSNISLKAQELLESGKVQLVIGYEKGTTGVIRPSFISDPQKTEKLICDENCVQNLAVYLTKPEVRKFGKIGIVAKIPVMRSIMVLISEQQVKPDDIIVMGIDSDGSVLELPDMSVMQAYIERSDLTISPEYRKKLDEIIALKPEERFAWWKKQFEKCIRCYACRQACPMCYCTRCAAEVNQPQWIPVKATAHGNMDWHILRAMHLAGRCVGCGECGRACPVGIPCHLLSMHLSGKVFDHFNVQAGTSVKMHSAMSTYDPNDKENFII